MSILVVNCQALNAIILILKVFFYGNMKAKGGKSVSKITLFVEFTARLINGIVIASLLLALFRKIGSHQATG